MENGSASSPAPFDTPLSLAAPLPPAPLNFIGRKLLRLAETIHGLGAFALITLGVTLTKFNVAAKVIHPLVRVHIHRAGVRLLPIISFLSCALGFAVIGQTVALLNRVGARGFTGTIMVTVVVRELGPIITALLVLARVGTATVIELGTARAMGEVEALEALGIDPIHYLVVPRVIGLALSIFSLTVYLILITLFSGYLFAFLQDVPLPPGDYLSQLAAAMRWDDFVLLTLKTVLFGAIIATVSCYEGLAKPLRLEEVSAATTRAVVQCIELVVLLDALFILFLLLV
ncbi:MAG: ABC transporter permease [Verrucomicrobia bacterium]|nr:ABC transporter permease [Verrucomicrobiota bacterium]